MVINKKLLRAVIFPTVFMITILANTWINIITFILRVSLVILSSVYTKLFRDYLISGPETSKTVIHYMARSITYVYQLITFIYILFCFLGWIYFWDSFLIAKLKFCENPPPSPYRPPAAGICNGPSPPI